MMRSRAGAAFAGLAVLVCVSILSGDQVLADRRAASDDRLVKGLQKQVQSDASLAPKLEAEKKRITDGRVARKKRDEILSWMTIAAASAFLVFAADTTPPLLRRRRKPSANGDN